MDLLDSIQDPQINHDEVYAEALASSSVLFREQLRTGTLSKAIKATLADTESQAHIAGHTVGRALGFTCSLLEQILQASVTSEQLQQLGEGNDNDGDGKKLMVISQDALSTLQALYDEGQKLKALSSTTVTSATDEDGGDLEVSETSIESFRRRVLAELRRALPAQQRKLIASTFPSYFLQDVGGPQSLAW